MSLANELEGRMGLTGMSVWNENIIEIKETHLKARDYVGDMLINL